MTYHLAMNSYPSIRLRACLAVVQEERILLVPHFDTDASAVQWNLPGGSVRFGERLQDAARRECAEETGILAEVTGLLDVSEVILPERPWHSVTVTYLARASGGVLRAEPYHAHGEKSPRWFSHAELKGIACHPAAVIRRALG